MIFFYSNSALDVLVDKLGGPKNVAEMTGRKGRIVRKDPTSKAAYELRSLGCVSDQSLNVSEVNSNYIYYCSIKY